MSVHWYGVGSLAGSFFLYGFAYRSVRHDWTSSGTGHDADQPETMARWAGRLQDATGSNMWSCRTKCCAYTQ